MQEWYMNYNSSLYLTESEKLYLQQFNQEEFNEMCINSKWVRLRACNNILTTIKEAVVYFMSEEYQNARNSN